MLNLYYSDLTDSSSLNNLINSIEPDEIYNLAAQSHVMVSFKNPIYTSQTGLMGTLSLLEAVKNTNKQIKFYQASSSEMYGGADSQKLNEISNFEPKSPYAASKVFLIMLQSFIENRMNYFVPMEYCLIMNLHTEVKLL